VLSSAVGLEALTDFATIARTELLLIDASSTVAELSKEIRWNQAYYRLAQGF
jgi:L-arabinose isomerase